jgi:hypothetical protein
MPRLSLYRPEKGNDYKFMDKTIYEMFQVGGTDVFVHKYLGPVDPTDANKATTPTTIQDVLFLENRDRKYDSTVYILRGVYNVQDIDFNLSQFGLFLQNDTIFMTIHINNTVETLGRKIMSGDVVELPHLIDDYALNDFALSLKRFYVVEDINRAAEGFAVTWWPHLYRLKLKPILDSQEFKDILDMPQNTDNFAGDYDSSKTYYPGQIIKSNGILYTVTQQCTGIEPPNVDYFTPLNPNDNLRALMSTYDIELGINQGVVAEAEADSPLSGYNTQNFYTIQLDENNNVALTTVDSSNVYIDSANTSDARNPTPDKSAYTGYLPGGNIPPNGAPFGFGIQFPENAALGDYFLRTDYLPSRLFRFDGRRWIKYEDDVRMTLTNNDDRQTQRTSFVNNKQDSNVKPLITDTFTVDPTKVFGANDQTVYLDIPNKKILTKASYNPAYGVTVYMNDTHMDIASIYEETGKLGFVCKFDLVKGAVLTWTIYQEKITQRVSLSKVLRPKADF